MIFANKVSRLKYMNAINISSIILFSYVTSPYAMKVHCYLLYKKRPFNTHYVNPIKPQEELPVGHQVPVLQIGQDARANSSAIGHWLDEVFPDTPSILPSDKKIQNSVLEMDRWVSETLIPITFYGVYPTIKNMNIYNTLRLGYCVKRTTSSGLLPGVHFLWPLFINRAGFIRRMVALLKQEGSVKDLRHKSFSYLEDILQNQRYLATDDKPSIADLSAWPQLIIPYELGLKDMDDFMKYPHIMRWIKEIGSHLYAPDLPPLVPEEIRKRKLI